MQLDVSQLRGMSYEKASLYGMPHIGAHYTQEGMKYRRDGRRNYEPTQTYCCICGKTLHRPNCHHVVPISYGEVFELQGKPLRSPLFAVCGSGTRGCHNGFHGGHYLKARWEWDTEEYERQWWSGELFNELEPNSPLLYHYGQWVISDTKRGRTIKFREFI